MGIKKQIVELFESNYNINVYDIANVLSLDVNFVVSVLNEIFGNYYSKYDDLYLVSSLSDKNIFFLFSSSAEKKIKTDKNIIQNHEQLSERELIWLAKNYNLQIQYNKFNLL